MAIHAQSSCTLSTITDVEAVYTYYYLSDSTITVNEAPKDNINVPGASTITVINDGENYVWTLTEPQLDIEDDVIQTAVGQLYYIECVKFSDGTYDWGPLMTSSTYAAAKAAYNLSSQALAQAQAANAATALLGGHFMYGGSLGSSTPAGARIIEQIKENNIDVSDNPSKWLHNVIIGSNGIELRYNEAIMAQLAANQSGNNTALKFYKPPTISGSTTTQGGLAMQLDTNGLSFYGSSQSTPDAQLTSVGLSITNGSIELANGTNAAIKISNSNFSRSINSINHNDLRMAIGNQFGITSDGTLYASNANISGVLTAGANSKIGPWNVSNNSIWYNNSTFGNANGIYLGTSGLSLGSAFQVTSAGIVTANNITVNGGKIGGWSIGTDTNKSLYYGNQKPGATDSNLVLSPLSATNTNAIAGSETGKTWFISAGQKFGVDTSGNLYATGAKISGEINAISGSIGNSTNKIIIGSTSTSPINSYIYSGSHSSLSSTNSGFYIGTDGLSIGSKFKYVGGTTETLIVDHITATNLTIDSGSIANTVTIGGKAQSDYLNSNIEIGGRNILRGTKNLNGWTLSNSSSGSNYQTVTLTENEPTYIVNFPDTSSGTIYEYINNNNARFPYSIIRNQHIILSADVKATNGATTGMLVEYGIYAEATGGSRLRYTNQKIEISGTGNWEKITYEWDITDSSFTAGSTTPDYNTCYIRFALFKTYDEGYTAGFQVKNLKLEVGNMVTDWTPAPEDVQADIDAKKSTWNLMSTSASGATYQDILGYAESTTTFTIDNSASGFDKATDVKVGDTVRLKYKATDMGSGGTYVYIIGKATQVPPTVASNEITLDGRGLDTTVIDGGHILTGTIDADRIGANSITASKMRIGDYNNYITATENDPNSILYGTISDGWIYKNNASASNIGLSPIVNNWTKLGEKYRVTGVVKIPSDGKIRVAIQGRRDNNDWVGNNEYTVNVSANVETSISGIITINSTVADCAKCSIAIYFHVGTTGNTYQVGYCKKMRLERMANAELIVDGSITTNALTVGARDAMLNDNIQVGGRNLIRALDETKVTVNKWGSSYTYANGKYVITCTTAGGGSSFTQIYGESGNGALAFNGVSPGDTVIFHVDSVVSSNSASEPRIYLDMRKADGTYISSVGIYQSLNNWVSIFTIPAEVAKYTLIVRLDQNKNAAVGDTLTVSGIKLEKGNKATDWTPAPEDVQNDIALSNRNMLLDWNASSLDKIDASSTRYYGNNATGSAYITPTFIPINDAPEPSIKYGVRFVGNGTNTAVTSLTLCFYSAQNLTALPFKDGCKYTISFWARRTAGNSRISIMVRNGTAWEYLIPTSTVPTSEWKRYYGVLDYKTADYNRLHFYAYFDANTSGTLEMCGFQCIANGDSAEATKYITAINDNGIRVHAANNPTSNYAKIDATGMEIYKSGYRKAQFGSSIYLWGANNASADASTYPQTAITTSGVTIAQSATNKATISSNGLDIYSGSSIPIANFSSSITLGSTGTYQTAVNPDSFIMSHDDLGNLYSIELGEDETRSLITYTTVSANKTVTNIGVPFTESLTIDYQIGNNAWTTAGTYVEADWAVGTSKPVSNIIFTRTTEKRFTVKNSNSSVVRINFTTSLTAPGLHMHWYGANNQLWEGALYMTDLQTIQLREPISAQPSGIVLVWSAYDSGAAQNHSWQTQYIPKGLIHNPYSTTTNGLNCNFILNYSNYFGKKILNIFDTSITGHAQNDDTVTSTTPDLYNAHFVLRFVYGV